MTIEGIPEDWELVKFDVPRDGDWLINSSGQPEQSRGKYSTVWPIIRKIECPKRYRPFANAAELKPYRDRWIQRSDVHDTKETLPAGCFRVHAYNDHHIWTSDGRSFSYEQMLSEGKTFDDGSPFGVEVTT